MLLTPIAYGGKGFAFFIWKKGGLKYGLDHVSPRLRLFSGLLIALSGNFKIFDMIYKSMHDPSIRSASPDSTPIINEDLFILVCLQFPESAQAYPFQGLECLHITLSALHQNNSYSFFFVWNVISLGIPSWCSILKSPGNHFHSIILIANMWVFLWWNVSDLFQCPPCLDQCLTEYIQHTLFEWVELGKMSFSKGIILTM